MFSVKLINHFVQTHEFWAHVLLFVGVFLEGEFVLITSGILAQLGALSFTVAFILGLGGAIVKTIWGYYFGTLMLRLFPDSKFFRYVEKKISYFLPRLKEKPFWSIFISKFIYGVNHLTLVFAGYFKVRYKTFFLAEFLSSIIWVFTLLSLGYFFSYTAFGITRDIRKVSMLILLFILGFVLLQKVIVFLFELIEELTSKE